MSLEKVTYPLAPNMNRSTDIETNCANSEEIRKQQKKRRIYIILGCILFQVIQILVFVLVIMRVRAPKVRVQDVESVSVAGNNISFTVVISVKNPNFFEFKHQESVVTFEYWGSPIEVVLPKRKVGFLSSKTSRLSVSITPENVPRVNLEDIKHDIRLGKVGLNATAELHGKFKMMMGMFTKKKIGTMKCALLLDLAMNNLAEKTCGR